MKNFFDLEEFDDATIETLLARATELQGESRDLLKGKVLGLLFMNPSLRTLASFQSGMAQLGGSSFVIQPGQGSWGLEVRDGVIMDGTAAEHIKEAIPVLEQYCDALGIRCFPDGKDLAADLREEVFGAIRRCQTGPIINMESAVGHPCQALADWKTLDDERIPRNGGKLVLSWAWHPKALPLAVPSAVVKMAARRGMDVTVLRPEGYALPPEIMTQAHSAAARSGGTVRETDQREEAMEGAHVVYAKAWGSPLAYGEPDAEAALRAGLRQWCVAEEWYATARQEAIFMHCLPVRRGVVVADEILDGPRSRVVPQAANRLHAQKAVLAEILTN